MPDKADVRSLDVLGDMRRSVILFQEEAKQSLSVASAEIQRTLQWVEHDRLPFWKSEVNRRHDALMKAKRDLQQAESQKKFGKVSTVDERKEVRRREEAVHEAREKVNSCQKMLRVLDKELTNYYGGVQGVSRLLEVDLPKASHRLKRMGDVLAEYAQGGGGGQASAAQHAQTRPETAGTASAPVATGVPRADVSTLNKLRQRVPREGARAEATRESRVKVKLIQRELNQAHADRVVLFAEDEDQPEKGQTMLVETGAESAEAIALVRTAPVDEEDSGWTVVRLATDGAMGTFLRVPVTRVVDTETPTFRALGLDQGWGMLLDGAGEGYDVRADVRCVFDQRDHVVWGTLDRSG
ncbi:MAG: hypothetical protein AAGI30_03940 [Planctomycetota bacterium]